MTSNDYIHINEAVKQYGKTRQTFYNYMHKGLLRTKKINNKVYLKRDDLQQLIDGFIPSAIELTHVRTTSEAEESFHEDIIEADTLTPDYAKQVDAEKEIDKNILLKDLARLHQQYYDLKDSIIQQVNHNKQDLLFDTKVISQNAEQRITMQLHQKIVDLQTSLKQGSGKNQQLLQKKSLFRAGYSCFLIINLLIINYIF